MGTSLGNAYVSVVPKMTGFAATIKKGFSDAGVEAGRSASVGIKAGLGSATYSTEATKAGKSAGGSFSKAFAAATAVGGVAAAGLMSLVGGLGDVASAAMAASDSADKFAATMEFAGVDSSKIDELLKSTKDYADQTVYDLSDIRNVTAQLAANGVDGYEQLAMAAGNLNAVAGGTAETFSSVGMVLTQTAGAGKLTTENWNQLADAIPGASGVLQEELLNMGAYTGNFRDALEAGEISAEEFMAAITNLGLTETATQAATDASTFEGAFGNMNASIESFATAVLDQFKPAITDALAGVADFFAGAEEAVGPTFDTLAAFAEDIAPSFEPVKAMFSDLGDTFSAMAEEYGPQLSEAFDTIAAEIPGIMEGLQPIIEALGNIGGTAIQDGFIAVTSAMKSLALAAQLVSDVLNGDWDSAWGTTEELFNLVTTNLNDLVDATFPDLVEGIDGALETLGGIPEQAGTFFGAVFEEAGTRIGDWAWGVQEDIDAVNADVSAKIDTWWTDTSAALSDGWASATETISNVPETVGALFTEAGDRVTTWASGAYDSVTTWGSDVLTSFGDTLSGLGADARTGLDDVKTWWDEKWTGIKDGVSTWGEDTKTAFSGKIDELAVLVEEWGIADKFTEAFSTVQSIIEAPFTAASDFVAGIPDTIVGFFTGIGDKITEAFGSISFPKPHVTWEALYIGDFETPISIPHIDWYATGGVFDSASLIGVGEAGPEAVVPLSGGAMDPFADAVAERLGSAGSTTNVYNLYLDGSALTADASTVELLRQLVDGIVEANGGRRAVFA